MVYAHLRCSDKPFMGFVTTPERAEDSIEMARVVFRERFVDGRCVIMGNIKEHPRTRSRTHESSFASAAARAPTASVLGSRAGEGSFHEHLRRRSATCRENRPA